MLHITVAALGVSAVIFSSPLAFDILRWAGAAYLLYLGIRTLMTKGEDAESESASVRPLRQIYREGIVVNLLNPKSSLFFFAFLPQFVRVERGRIPLQVVLLGLIFMAIAFTTDSTYALLAGRLRNWLREKRRILSIQRTAAGVIYLILAAVAIVSYHR